MLFPDPLAIAAERLRAGHRVAAPREFASPDHEAFYASRAPEICASSAMGMGKSRVLCQKAWDLALQYPGAQLGLFRKVQNSLAATTEVTFWSEVADMRFVVARNRSEHWVDVGAPGGRVSRIWFLGLDPNPETHVPSKVGSLNLDWAGVDEAIELTEPDWIMLGGRLRRTSIPFRQLAAVTNPASPKHWLKRRFTPATDTRQWFAFTQNRFLPEDFLARLASMGDDVTAQRLAKGMWVAAEGTIWFLPDDQIRAPGQDTWKRVVGGIDWGFVHAFAAEIVGESGSGRKATLDEVYHRGKLLDDLIPILLEKQALWKVQVWYADPSEPEYIATCRKRGLKVEPATNDMTPGLTEVATSIKAGETVDPRCLGLLSEIPEYTWQRDRATNMSKEKPIEVNDDACDAWRYAHMGLATGETGLLGYYRDITQKRAAAAAEAARA